MRMRTRVAKVGAKAWAVATPAFPLPDGLSDRELVTVEEFDFPAYTVRAASGMSFRLQHQQIDCGADYSGPAGNWLPEEHPKVRAALQSALESELAHPPDETATSSSRAYWRRYVDQLGWVIERTAPAKPSSRSPCQGSSLPSVGGNAQRHFTRNLTTLIGAAALG
jgi:hypothetical protein